MRKFLIYLLIPLLFGGSCLGIGYAVNNSKPSLSIDPESSVDNSSSNGSENVTSPESPVVKDKFTVTYYIHDEVYEVQEYSKDSHCMPSDFKPTLSNPSEIFIGWVHSDDRTDFYTDGTVLNFDKDYDIYGYIASANELEKLFTNAVLKYSGFDTSLIKSYDGTIDFNLEDNDSYYTSSISISNLSCYSETAGDFKINAKAEWKEDETSVNNYMASLDIDESAICSYIEFMSGIYSDYNAEDETTKAKDFSSVVQLMIMNLKWIDNLHNTGFALGFNANYTKI